MKQIRNIYVKAVAAAMTALTVLTTGCQVKDVETYENDPALYYYYNSSASFLRPLVQLDYINQTFFNLHSSINTDTVTIYVSMMGFPETFDRPIRMIQVNAGEEDAAVEGVHYVPFDDEYVKENMMMKAGQVQAQVKIILKRHESLELDTKNLLLALAENEHFRLRNEVNQPLFAVLTTAKAAKPTIWDSYWKSWFGSTWGSVKMKFIIDTTGYTDWEDKLADVNYLSYLKEMVQKAFYEYNQDNPDNPLREADGTLVIFT